MPNQQKKRSVQRKCKIGVVGSGALLATTVRRLTDAEFSTAFPWVQLAGLVRSGKAGKALPEQLPLYDDIYALLAAHTDLNLIFDLGADAARHADLRAALPPGVGLIDRANALLLWDMMTVRIKSGAQSCERALDHASTLFTTLFNEVEEDIILLDRQGRIIDANTNAWQRRGIPKQQLVGRRCGDIDSPDFCYQPKEGSCPFQRTLRTGKKAESVHTTVGADGRMFYYRVYTYPIYNAARELTHVMELRRDITQRTYMEQRLQQAEKMAAIGELSTYIAHEIRNPLFAIGGFANALLRSSSLDEPAREKVAIILEESRRLDRILKSTLSFARSSTGELDQVDLNVVVAQTMELMGIGFESQGIEPQIRTRPGIARVKADPELLKQCLINMIKNSVEAMPNGGQLIVRTGMRRKYVYLEVEDSGRGIPHDIQKKVFNPFFSTKIQGSGLGLPMIKKIVDELGGKVELNSECGRGTRLTLLLPPLLAVDEEPEVFQQIL